MLSSRLREWVVSQELLLGPFGASVGQQLESGDTQ